MLITQEEIAAALEQFIRSALSLQTDPDYGTIDSATEYDQLRDVVVTRLLLDYNAVFYLPV